MQRQTRLLTLKPGWIASSSCRPPRNNKSGYVVIVLQPAFLPTLSSRGLKARGDPLGPWKRRDKPARVPSSHEGYRE